MFNWLRPVGLPKSGKCPGCAERLATAYIPIDGRKANHQHRFDFCRRCKVAWSRIDRSADYKLYRVNGALRAKPI